MGSCKLFGNKYRLVYESALHCDLEDKQTLAGTALDEVTTAGDELPASLHSEENSRLGPDARYIQRPNVSLINRFHLC